MIPSQNYHMRLLIYIHDLASRMHDPSMLFPSLFTDQGDPNKREVQTRLADGVPQACHYYKCSNYQHHLQSATTYCKETVIETSHVFCVSHV